MNLPKIFNIIKVKKGKQYSTITGINIKYLGSMHEISGMKLADNVFELKIPFQNKQGMDLLADHIKRPDLVLAGAKISQPFELLEATPEFPVSVSYKDKIEIVMKIKAPEVAYTGPMTIEFSDKPEDKVRIGITKISMFRQNKSADVEESATILTVNKGQMFKRDFQLYAIVEYGDFIEKIEANKPFEVSGTEPKAPFQINRKDSFIISIFLKMPNYNYTGPLEIYLK